MKVIVEILCLFLHVQLNGATYKSETKFSGGGVGRNIAEGLQKLNGAVSLISAFGRDQNGEFLRGTLPAGATSSSWISDTSPTANCAIVLDRFGDCKLCVGDMTIHREITPDLVSTSSRNNSKWWSWIFSFHQFPFEFSVSFRKVHFSSNISRLSVDLDLASSAVWKATHFEFMNSFQIYKSAPLLERSPLICIDSNLSSEAMEATLRLAKRLSKPGRVEVNFIWLILSKYLSFNSVLWADRHVDCAQTIRDVARLLRTNQVHIAESLRAATNCRHLRSCTVYTKRLTNRECLVGEWKAKTLRWNYWTVRQSASAHRQYNRHGGELWRFHSTTSCCWGCFPHKGHDLRRREGWREELPTLSLPATRDDCQCLGRWRRFLLGIYRRNAEAEVGIDLRVSRTSSCDFNFDVEASCTEKILRIGASLLDDTSWVWRHETLLSCQHVPNIKIIETCAVTGFPLEKISGEIPTKTKIGGS